MSNIQTIIKKLQEAGANHGVDELKAYSAKDSSLENMQAAKLYSIFKMVNDFRLRCSVPHYDIIDRQKGNKQLELRTDGLRLLAEREGYSIRTKIVYKGDVFEYQNALDKPSCVITKWETKGERIALDENLNSLHAVVCYVENKNTNDMTIWVVHGEDIKKRKPKSSPVWKAWTEQMVVKTAVSFIVKQQRLYSLDFEADVAIDPYENYEQEATTKTNQQMKADALKQLEV